MGSSTPEVRAAQSFVRTLSLVWQRPSLTALEVAWRWAYGGPALALVGWQLRKVLLAVTSGTLDPAQLGLDKTLLNDVVGALSAAPLEAAGKFAGAIALLRPGTQQAGIWLVPLLVFGWVLASSLGRTLVLRRTDSRLHRRVPTMIGLQAIRVLALGVVFWAWFGMVGWSARVTVTRPIATGAEPNLVGYCAMVIVSSLSMFTAWAFVSWMFTVAPLLAMVKGIGAGASLRAAFALGPLRGKLAEVNLVLGIVKIALIVLAMVFSATPLPFQDVTTPAFLAWWWAGVTVLYLLWSDFFHVARLVAYLELWRAYEDHV